VLAMAGCSRRGSHSIVEVEDEEELSVALVEGRLMLDSSEARVKELPLLRRRTFS